MRDEPSVVDEPRPPVERELFTGGSSHHADDDRQEPSRAPFGISTWMVAAAALVIGILIGFASGFSAGQRAGGAAGVADETPAPVAATDDVPAAPASGREFTEGAVGEPVRVDPPPIVEAPATPAAEPAAPGGEARPRQAERPASERPAAAPRPRPAPPAVVERPRETRPAGSVPPPAASGPGSLQVVSRPAGADVLLDGRVIGRTPLLVSDVGTGNHEVRLQLSGFRPWGTSVTVTAGARTRVAASLEQ